MTVIIFLLVTDFERRRLLAEKESSLLYLRTDIVVTKIIYKAA